MAETEPKDEAELYGHGECVVKSYDNVGWEPTASHTPFRAGDGSLIWISIPPDPPNVHYRVRFLICKGCRSLYAPRKLNP